MKYIRIIRLGWICGLSALVLFLIYRAVAPFGSIVYTHNFLHDNYFISPFSPKERLAGDSGRDQRLLISEPVYFFLRTMRPFKTAEIKVSYTNPAPFMELGICRDKTVWNFERQPLYIKNLETLATDQNSLKENGLILWQKQKKYSTIKDFLHTPPAPEKIAVYNYNIKTSFRLGDYKNLTSERIIPVGLRGGYTIVTYTNNDPIKFTLNLHQEISNSSYRSLEIIGYSEEGKIIYEENFLNQVDNTVPNTSRLITITTPILPTGPYRFEFKIDDSIITDTITTTQAKLSFLNTLNFANSGRGSITLVTDGSYLKAQTFNPERLQTISIEKQSLDLNKTYYQFSVSLQDQTRSIKTIKLTGDDSMIASDGIFAFSAAEAINPFPRSYNLDTNPTTEGLEYILAHYDPIGNAQHNSRIVTFTLNSNCLDKGRYPFLVSAPNIDSISPLEIERISLRLSGLNLIEYIQKLWRDL